MGRVLGAVLVYDLFETHNLVLMRGIKDHMTMNVRQGGGDELEIGESSDEELEALDFEAELSEDDGDVEMGVGADIQ